MYVMNKNAVLVSLASHTQYVPQVSLPHILPVTKETATNKTPISPDAPATRSHARERFLADKYTPEHTAVIANAIYAVQMDGT
ncbi:unannotated protein [freshwater metagenome]|uniref:Unannotated protein n=1 Tax=freshwater metagenome TaxID=449393 RepID=A0A6J6UPZ5_9ZZZZ